MKKILYIIVILVVLGLIFFMFPGVYLKYSITNKLPKEKYSLVYIKPTLKKFDVDSRLGTYYDGGGLFFRIKENVVSDNVKTGPNNDPSYIIYIEGGKKIITSTFNNIYNLEYLASVTPDDIKIFDSRSNSKLKYKLLLDKALLFPHTNSTIFNLFKSDEFLVIQNSSHSYTTTSLYVVYKVGGSFQIVLKDFSQDQIEELIASFMVESYKPI